MWECKLRIYSVTDLAPGSSGFPQSIGLVQWAKLCQSVSAVMEFHVHCRYSFYEYIDIYTLRYYCLSCVISSPENTIETPDYCIVHGNYNCFNVLQICESEQKSEVENM